MNPMTTEEIVPSMPFEDRKIQAIVHRMLTDHLFFVKASPHIGSNHLGDPYLAIIYDTLLKFHQNYKRLPSSTELLDQPEIVGKERPIREKVGQVLAALPEAAAPFGIDVLRKDVERWMKNRVFLETARQVERLYNQSDKDITKLDKALTQFQDGALRMSNTTFDDGKAATFDAAPNRFAEEADDRAGETILEYGITFLDHAIGGMIPKDVILLGGATGGGKTQLAAAVAQHNAKKFKKRVHFFALEAEKYEIERRIKFTQLSQMYYTRQKGSKDNPRVPIRYGQWRRGEVEHLLSPYYPKVQAWANENLSTLYTFYREDGIFDNDTLEQRIKMIVGETDLIIIDHIHYIDVIDDNENTAYKRVIKTLRDIALRYGIPIIVIAHLRKLQNERKPTLVPNIHDFHGTSDLTKISTTCIMLARAWDRGIDSMPWIRPTYIRIPKSRIEGDIGWTIGIAYYDLRTNSYLSQYDIGRLTNGDTVWEPLKDNKVPYWAHPNPLINPDGEQKDDE